MTDQPIWVPPHARKKSSNLARFMTRLADRQHRPFPTYEALHAYSIAEPGGFWSAVWDEFGILAETRGQTLFAEAGHMRHPLPNRAQIDAILSSVSVTSRACGLEYDFTKLDEEAKTPNASSVSSSS